MSRKLTIPYYRPTFVQKELSEVGPGTFWPVEVTADQVAEIFYRVRDAEWTGGFMEIREDPPGSSGETINIAGSRPTLLIEEAYADALNYAQCQRGYSYISGGVVPISTFSWPLPDYNGSTEPSDDFYGADYQSGTLSPTSVWRDILNDELGIFHLTSRVTGLSFISVVRGSVPAYQFSCSEIDADGEHYASLTFSSIAWVDNDSSSNPFSAANQLFLGVRFEAFFRREGIFPMARFYVLSSLLQTVLDEGGDDTIVNSVEIELAGSSLSIPIYGSFFSDAVTVTPYSVSPFTLTATEWWPYAKPDPDNPGSTIPVWDTATGAKL